MRLLEKKTPINIEFPGTNIDLDKEFLCPECEEKATITTDQAKNVASRVISTSVLFHERNRIISDYEKGKFKDYFDYAVPMAKIEHQLMAIGDPMTSLNTSVGLPCEHKISIRIECGIEITEEPKKVDVLHKLGLNTENAQRWLSYIYTGRPNKKFGVKKAAEIMDFVDSYFREKQAFSEFGKETLAKIPRSVTGLEGRISGDISKTLNLMNSNLDAIMKSLIHELDETLARVAMRPDVIPRGGWVAQG